MPCSHETVETINTLCLVLLQIIPIAFILVVIYGGLLVLLVLRDQIVHVTFRLRIVKLKRQGFRSILFTSVNSISSMPSPVYQ